VPLCDIALATGFYQRLGDAVWTPTTPGGQRSKLCSPACLLALLCAERPVWDAEHVIRRGFGAVGLAQDWPATGTG
jgi:hypothetical protein